MIDQDRVIRNLQQRLDRIAIHQLREEVARLSEENDSLRKALEREQSEKYQAEAQADYWHENFQEVSRAIDEESSVSLGLKKSGEIIVLKTGEAK